MTNVDSGLWPQVLEQLRTTMTKQTFDAWLKDTTATQNNGRLTIVAGSTYAIDWLEHRLRNQVEQAVANVAGRELEVEFKVSGSEEAHQPDLFFTGTYRDAYNQTVRPDRVFVGTQYFRQRWLPLLGQTLWLLILEMRQRCFWDKATGEKRDTFEATYAELAASIGIDERSVRRLLKPKDPTKKALVDRFVVNAETTRRYSKYRGGAVNKNTRWKIRLDDPLTPEDEAQLTDLSK